MADFLVFQLHGVLASWGDIAVGEYRPTLSHPTKSALTGLLAAALGIDRKDEKAHLSLTQQFGIAVAVFANGELLRDYHTVQVPSGNRHYANRRDELLRDGLNLNTLLSQREYRTDAFYLIAIWQKQQEVEYSLEALRQALMQPKYNLYLGRKSCPASLPLFPQTVKDKTLKQSFDQYAQNNTEQWLKQLVPTAKVSDSLVSYYWEPGLTQEQLGEQMVSTMTYTKKDQLRSRQRWQYTDREEFYCVHPYSHSEPSQSEDNALSTEGGR